MDIHTHIVPGIDDGASSMEEALNIIEEIEDEAKLFLLLGDRGIAMTKAQQNALPSHGLRF